MLLLGIKPKLSNPFAGGKSKELDSPGLAYRYSRGVDYPVVCYSQGVDLWEYAPFGDSIPQEYAPPRIKAPRQHAPSWAR